LTTPGNLEAAVAALRALADDARPDPQLVPELRALLDNEKTSEPAAQALGAYKGNADALDALVRAAGPATGRWRFGCPRSARWACSSSSPPPPRSCGSPPGATSRARSPPPPSTALAEMTGLEANGRDPARWEQWLRDTGGRPPADWKADLVNPRAAREDRLRRRSLETTEAVERLLTDEYQALPPGDRPEQLLRYCAGRCPRSGASARGSPSRTRRSAPAARTPPAVQQRSSSWSPTATPACGATPPGR
jgi:hypothetical protein